MNRRQSGKIDQHRANYQLLAIDEIFKKTQNKYKHVPLAVAGPSEIKLKYKERPHTNREKKQTIFGSLLAESHLPDDFDQSINNLEKKVEKGDYTKYMITTLLELYN